jgi:hypothetical protein
MQKLTSEGQRVVAGLAERHGFGEDAVTQMVFAMPQGNGSLAQFSHRSSAAPANRCGDVRSSSAGVTGQVPFAAIERRGTFVARM